jgi:hypothetical protein
MLWTNSLTRATFYVNLYALAYKQERTAMGTLTASELARLWTQEQLPTERAVGQMLQQLVVIQAALDRQAQTISELRSQIADLAIQSQPNITMLTAQKRRKIKG